MASMEELMEAFAMSEEEIMYLLDHNYDTEICEGRICKHKNIFHFRSSHDINVCTIPNCGCKFQ